MKILARFLSSAVLVAGATGAVHAAYDFSVSLPSTPGTPCATASGVTNCTAGDDRPSVELKAWANTGGSYAQGSALGGIQQATLVGYGGGLGATNKDGSFTTTADKDFREGNSPEHAIDNEGRFEMVSLDFGSTLVRLSSVNFGWAGSDSDFSVLAFTGAGTPDIGALTQWGDLMAPGSGWTLVGNYDSNGTGIKTFNSGQPPVAASFWLIGAYNPVFGTASTNSGAVDTCGGYGWVTVNSSSGYGCNSKTYNADYFKLAAVAGRTVDPTQPSSQGVPEPGSSLLASSALAGLAFLRRRKLFSLRT